MTGQPDLESRSNGQYALPVPLFVTMCTAARTFLPRTMLWYFLAIEVVSSCHARGPPPHPPNEGGLFHLPHKGQIASCIPSIEPTPYDRLDIMEAGDPTDTPKDARLKDQIYISNVLSTSI